MPKLPAASTEIQVYLTGVLIPIIIGLSLIAFFLDTDYGQLTWQIAVGNFVLAAVLFLPFWPLNGWFILRAILGIAIGAHKATICLIWGSMWILSGLGIWAFIFNQWILGILLTAWATLSWSRGRSDREQLRYHSITAGEITTGYYRIKLHSMELPAKELAKSYVPHLHYPTFPILIETKSEGQWRTTFKDLIWAESDQLLYECSEQITPDNFLFISASESALSFIELLNMGFPTHYAVVDENCRVVSFLYTGAELTDIEISCEPWQTLHFPPVEQTTPRKLPSIAIVTDGIAIARGRERDYAFDWEQAKRQSLHTRCKEIVDQVWSRAEPSSASWKSAHQQAKTFKSSIREHFSALHEGAIHAFLRGDEWEFEQKSFDLAALSKHTPEGIYPTINTQQMLQLRSKYVTEVAERPSYRSAKLDSWDELLQIYLQLVEECRRAFAVSCSDQALPQFSLDFFANYCDQLYAATKSASLVQLERIVLQFLALEHFGHCRRSAPRYRWFTDVASRYDHLSRERYYSLPQASACCHLPHSREEREELISHLNLTDPA